VKLPLKYSPCFRAQKLQAIAIQARVAFPHCCNRSVLVSVLLPTAQLSLSLPLLPSDCFRSYLRPLSAHSPPGLCI
jgi:hypothetical protein